MESWTEEADERLLLRRRVFELEQQNTELRTAVGVLLNSRAILRNDLDGAIESWSKRFGAAAREVLGKARP